MHTYIYIYIYIKGKSRGVKVQAKHAGARVDACVGAMGWVALLV